MHNLHFHVCLPQKMVPIAFLLLSCKQNMANELPSSQPGLSQRLSDRCHGDKLVCSHVLTPGMAWSKPRTHIFKKSQHLLYCCHLPTSNHSRHKSDEYTISRMGSTSFQWENTFFVQKPVPRNSKHGRKTCFDSFAACLKGIQMTRNQNQVNTCPDERPFFSCSAPQGPHQVSFT